MTSETAIAVPAEVSARLSTLKGLYIGGEFRATGSGKPYTHISAITGRPTGEVAMAGKADVDDAVAAAVAAAPAWRKFPAVERGKLMHRLADIFAAEVDTLAELFSFETGIPIALARGSMPIMEDWTRYYAGWCDKIMGESVNNAPGGRWVVSREPYGPVAMLLTWNFPETSVCMKVMAALATGNAVIIKSPEIAPYGLMYVAELFERAGFPKGVVSILAGGPEAGEALCSHPDIGKISFTGGTPTAAKIMQAASANITPTLFELGGKSACIVMDDGIVENAVGLVANFIVAHAGQACIVPSRLLVHESLYDRAVELAHQIIASRVVGDPFDPSTQVGPVISQAACDRITGMIDAAVANGYGRLVTGGKRLGGRFAEGYFIEPTLFVDVKTDSPLFQQEIFGPVLAISRFSTEEEAVSLANSTRFGLYSYLFTQNMSRALRIADQMTAGSVAINGFANLQPQVPFGGYGISGYGKEGGIAGLEEFLRSKTLYIAD